MVFERVVQELCRSRNILIAERARIEAEGIVFHAPDEDGGIGEKPASELLGGNILWL